MTSFRFVHTGDIHLDSPLKGLADYERGAAAGLEVMGQLAEKTQVLFFTHHEHLVEIARKTFGPSLSVISLLQCPDDNLI